MSVYGRLHVRWEFSLYDLYYSGLRPSVLHQRSRLRYNGRQLCRVYQRRALRSAGVQLTMLMC